MTLYVKPMSALLTRDTETFSNMDPYAVIEIGNDKKKTKVHKEGGKKPRWDEVFTFKPKGNKMVVTVFDKDPLSDDKVGSGAVDLAKYLSDPTEHKEYISLTYNGKSAGKIYVSIKYMNDGAQGPHSNWGGNQQQSNWGGNQQQSNWGGNQQPSNWGGSQPSNWGGNQQQQQQWGQPNQPGQQSWGQQPNQQWGQQPPQSGWGNPSQPQQQQSNWGTNQSSWGQNGNNQQPPQMQGIAGQLAGNLMGGQGQPNQQNSSWGNQQGQAPSQWGSNNNGWGNPNQGGQNGWNNGSQNQGGW